LDLLKSYGWSHYDLVTKHLCRVLCGPHVKLHQSSNMYIGDLQESIASELANRMNAMNNASDNARDLKKNLTQLFNRNRQAKITGEILEIVAGANA
jgi:ATP synthase F1 gamma subunit